MQLAEEDVVKNITRWTLLGHHNSSAGNGSTVTPPPLDPADVPRGPCWETTVGIVRNSLCSLWASLGWGLLLLLMFLALPGLKFSLQMASLFPTLAQQHQGSINPWPQFSSYGGEIPSWTHPGHAQLRGPFCEEHKRPCSLQPCLHCLLVQITTAPLKEPVFSTTAALRFALQGGFGTRG